MLIPQVWVDLAEHDLAVSLPDAHHVILTGPWRAGKYPQEVHPFTRGPGQDHVVGVGQGDGEIVLGEINPDLGYKHYSPP